MHIWLLLSCLFLRWRNSLEIYSNCSVLHRDLATSLRTERNSLGVVIALFSMTAGTEKNTQEKTFANLIQNKLQSFSMFVNDDRNCASLAPAGTLDVRH